MLHHHTDPAKRAEDVATREARIVWNTTGDYYKWITRWLEVYNQTLAEFAGGPT